MEKKEMKNELFYLECVETTFRTLDKALLDCMSKLANYILVSNTFASDERPKCINLLNFLNAQELSCKAFIDDYKKMMEEV